MNAGDNEVALTLVHTADWHLGKRFPQLGEEDGRKLTRARLDVVDRILGVADQRGADALLCAGDLFDDEKPSEDWWRGLATVLSKPRARNLPIFLLPGNHDPLTATSVWAPHHPFRGLLPKHVHVVDRDDFSYTLKDGAVLFGVPCRSSQSHRHLSEKIPQREPGDERIRIGMLHGSTFEMENYQTTFPIDVDAATKRGLDYLAIGDTHGYRNVAPSGSPPVVYPGAPEPTAFDEKDPGHVTVVFFTRSRRPRIEKVKVAQWTWEEAILGSMDELRSFCQRRDLVHRFVRLTVRITARPEEYAQAERLLRELRGTEACHGKVGMLLLDQELTLDTSDTEAVFAGASDVMRLAAAMLKERAEGPNRQVAEKALFHLYMLVQRASASRGA